MAASSHLFSILPGSPSASILLLVVIILVSVLLFLSKKSNLPPGPWAPIPYIGYAPNVVYALYNGESLYKFLARLGKTYGGVFSFTALGIPFVVLNDRQAIRKAFQDTKLSDRGDNKMQAKVFSRTFNKFDDMGPWRTFVLASFRKFGIGTARFEEPICKESTYLIEELTELKGQPVDLTWHLNNSILNIISKVAFGTRFELSDERVHRLANLLKRQNELAGSGGLEIFIPIDIPSKAKEEMSKNANELLEFMNNEIDSHRTTFDPNNINNIIDVWLNELRLHKSDDPGSFRNRDNMPGLLILLFLGGTDTIANTLQWGIQYLVRYHEVQERVHREIDTVVGRNRLPKLSDRSNLPYAESVIAEINRIISIFPLAGFHVAGDTTSLRGYTIPKNSVVVSNLYAVLHNPEIWGDPEEFRPERFLDGDGNFHEPDDLISFGLGHRNCVGEALARQELFIYITHLLHQFKLEKTSEDAPMPTLKPIDGVVTHPEPYELRVIKRE